MGVTPDQKAIVLFLNEKKGWHRPLEIKKGSRLPKTDFDSAFDFLNQNGYINRQDIKDVGTGQYVVEFCLNGEGEALASVIQGEVDKDMTPHLMNVQLDLMREQLKELRERPEKEKERRDQDFKRTLITAGIGIVLGGLTTAVATKCSQEVERPTLLFPIIHQKNQTFHDTIYIATPTIGKDTLLVRAVKQSTTSTNKP